MPGIDKLVTITLDKERHLRLTLMGMVGFEKITGKRLLEGFELKDLTLADNAAMLWACLVHEDEELTYNDVLRMVDFSNITPAMEALTTCLIQSLPDAKKENGHPLVKKPRAG